MSVWLQHWIFFESSKKGSYRAFCLTAKFFQGQQNYENDGELRRIVNTGYTDKKCFVKRYEALQVDFGKHPHDEAHRLKSIDSTPFINPVWLI